MDNPTVTVRIDRKGKTTMNIEGIEGTSCATYTEALLRNAPSAEVVDHKRKDEYYIEVDAEAEVGT